MKCDYCMQDHNSERYTNNQCPTCGAQKPVRFEHPLQNNMYPGQILVHPTQWQSHYLSNYWCGTFGQ